VGFCGLNSLDAETVEVMYAVMPIARKQGYATEIAIMMTRHAFNNLGYHRAIALIMPANEYSAIVATRAGFKDNGFVRAANFPEKVHQFILERKVSDGSNGCICDQ
jgi:[ribosomal protein S5]-alanine N-acetyltransferase